MAHTDARELWQEGARVDNRADQTRFAKLVQEGAVQHDARGRFQAETDVRQADDRVTIRQLLAELRQTWRDQH